MNNNLEEQVKQVIEQEKGNRQDLNLLANSYLVQLKKRNDQWKMSGYFEKTGRKLWTNAEFSDMRQTVIEIIVDINNIELI
jgi:phosphoribosyl-AMP cyclohydrolase